MITFYAGDIDKSIDIAIYDDAGLPVTGLIASTMPTIKYSMAVGADVTITPSDLSALTDAHSDGGVKERGDGIYRLDLPDAMFSAVTSRIHVRGEAEDKRLLTEDIQVISTSASEPFTPDLTEDDISSVH